MPANLENSTMAIGLEKISFHSNPKRKEKPVSSVQFTRSAVSYSLQPMGSSMPGFPVYHQLPEFTQTYVHWVSDAIQQYHLLSSPSPTALNLSQHQGLFKWVSSLYQVAKVSELQLQHQSFRWVFRTDFLEDGLVGSPCTPKDSQESPPTPQFKSVNSLVLSLLCSPSIITHNTHAELSLWRMNARVIHTASCTEADNSLPQNMFNWNQWKNFDLTWNLSHHSQLSLVVP